MIVLNRSQYKQYNGVTVYLFPSSVDDGALW